MEKFIRFLLMMYSIVLLFSCRKDNILKYNEKEMTVTDRSMPSGAIFGVQLTGRSAGVLEFSIDIAVFRDSKNLEDRLKKENFSMDTSIQPSARYCFRVQKVNLVRGSNVAPYSALMLMDQSGSIKNTDTGNYRLDAAKAFCSHLGPGDNVMLWSFTETDLQPWGTGFTTDGNALLPGIEDLRGKQKGVTPLYKSQYEVTNFTAANAPSVNKAVLTFTDGEDTEGGFSAREVAGNALSKNIKLYNIGLSSARAQVLSEQAMATGGAFMYAQDARQLISMFGNLGKLLNKTADYYHTTWSVSNCNGSLSSGSIMSAIRISLPYSKSHITIPFNLKY